MLGERVCILVAPEGGMYQENGNRLMVCIRWSAAARSALSRPDSSGMLASLQRELVAFRLRLNGTLVCADRFCARLLSVTLCVPSPSKRQPHPRSLVPSFAERHRAQDHFHVRLRPWWWESSISSRRFSRHRESSLLLVLRCLVSKTSLTTEWGEVLGMD